MIMGPSRPWIYAGKQERENSLVGGVELRLSWFLVDY